jgi:PhnB protein
MAQSTTPIPSGFHSLTPHLVVKGAAEYIDFLKKAFNAVEIRRAPGPGGKLMHALMQIGDSMLMLADDFSTEFHMTPYVDGNLPVYIQLYVPDVDAVYNQAVAAGATATMPVSDQFWGDRYGHVRDPFGFHWAIATHMEDPTPAELAERQRKMFGGERS